MAGFDIGRFLMAFGPGVTDTTNAYVGARRQAQEDELRKRQIAQQMALVEQSLQRGGMELEDAQRGRQMRQQGEQALDQYLAGEQDTAATLSGLSFAPGVREQAAQTQLMPGKYEALPSRPLMDQQQKLGLLRFAPYSKQVESVLGGVGEMQKREDSLADTRMNQQFQTGERVGRQEYGTSEREAGQEFQAQQNALNRQYNERMTEQKTSEKMTKEDKNLSKIDTTLRNDFDVKNSTKQLQYAASVKKLLSTENPVANDASRTQIARLSGEVGVLTDRDVARFGGRQDAVSKVKRMGKKIMTGKLTMQDRKDLREVAELFELSAQEKLNNRLMNLAQGQSEAYGVPIDRIMPLVNAYGTMQDMGQEQSQAIPDTVIQQAQEAINDPDAPEEIKSKAREILSNAGRL